MRMKECACCCGRGFVGRDEYDRWPCYACGCSGEVPMTREDLLEEENNALRAERDAAIRERDRANANAEAWAKDRDETHMERDAAIRERDERPAISREDARAWKRGKENASTWRDEDGQKRVIEALRAHAAGSDAKGGENG